LNRAGLLTNDSQEGFTGLGYGDSYWRQHAAVTGFCDLATFGWLDRALSSRYERIGHLGVADRDDDTGAVALTTRDDKPHTSYGAHLSEDTVRELYDGAGRQAVDDVCNGWQVTIYDPIPGGNVLWPVLRQAADQRLAQQQATAASDRQARADSAGLRPVLIVEDEMQQYGDGW
jgi:hypothetical protein